MSVGWKVLIAEVPLGHSIVPDGTLLSCCVYSFGSSAASGGTTSHKPGAIRLLAVSVDFLGLCIGQRMLSKVEKDMAEKSCDFNCVCVASTRKSMWKWAERRGYKRVSAVDFPVDKVPFRVKDERKNDLKLFVYEKWLRESKVVAGKEKRVEGESEGRQVRQTQTQRQDKK